MMAILFTVFYDLLIIFYRSQRLSRQREEGDHVEYGHKTDAHISQVPHKGVGGQTTDEEHHQGNDLVDGLRHPMIAKDVGHIGTGVKQDAQEGGKAKQPQDDSDEDNTKLSQVMSHGRFLPVVASTMQSPTATEANPPRALRS